MSENKTDGRSNRQARNLNHIKLAKKLKKENKELMQEVETSSRWSKESKRESKHCPLRRQNNELQYKSDYEELKQWSKDELIKSLLEERRRKKLLSEQLGASSGSLIKSKQEKSNVKLLKKLAAKNVNAASVGARDHLLRRDLNIVISKIQNSVDKAIKYNKTTKMDLLQTIRNEPKEESFKKAGQYTKFWDEFVDSLNLEVIELLLVYKKDAMQFYRDPETSKL